ncbi:MAG TPA: IS1182 family transposase [Gemmatimonadaceae bacterium]|nr:IS1182 family transposase [Gemmatimonadaceae bacterium]HXD49488.1 IS1182 family transposase [Gemmatimonadaceae bacterium]
MKSYRPYSPEQSFLLPPSPREWLADGHLAYFVLDLVADLDLGAIEHALQSRDPRGERPYAPRMMVALLLYGYATGVISSRKLERATYEDVAFRVLAAGEHPHFTSINGFRDRHRVALAGLFDQLLHECMSAGLVKLGHVAIDGTKMKANASKHKAMSFERMNQTEKKLTSEIEAYFDLAKKIDAEEDERYGVGEQAHDLPAELRRREDRLAKIREVRAALKKETARARATELVAQADQLRLDAAQPTTTPKKQGEFATLAAQRDQQAGELFDRHDDDDDEPPPPSVDDDLPRHTPPKRPDGTPKPNAQRNFTDEDSRIMMRDGAFLQAYNGQIAVDESPHQIIVAAALSNQPPDVEYFRPMLERAVANCGAPPDRVTADSGYFSADNVRAAERLGAEPFISVGKHKNDGELETRLVAHRATPDRVAMAALLATERGRAAYARRKATVEPVFGQIRTCQSYQHVSFRGLLKNRLEWLLVCATHNLRKLWRAATQPIAIPAAA